jgi:DNA segregation ATPase FtsK/SpoIIIE, S-DNA-T family
VRDHPPLPPVALPTPPEPRRPAPPPVLSLVVPVAGSLVLWAVTGSAMSLAFAAIGPLLMLAGMLDGRWRVRRERRHDERRYAERLAEVAELIEERHREERREAAARAPSVRELARHSAVASRWGSAPSEPLVVRLGLGELPSALRLTPERIGAEVHEVERLRVTAARLSDAPLTVDLRGGLGVTGHGADALVRSVLLQALSRVPGSARLRVEGEAEAWVTALPHEVQTMPAAAAAVVRFGIEHGIASATVARLPDAARWPQDCDTVVSVGAGSARVLRHPELPFGTSFVADTVSSIEALRLARGLAAVATSAGADIA